MPVNVYTWKNTCIRCMFQNHSTLKWQWNTSLSPLDSKLGREWVVTKLALSHVPRTPSTLASGLERTVRVGYMRRFDYRNHPYIGLLKWSCVGGKQTASETVLEEELFSFFFALCNSHGAFQPQRIPHRYWWGKIRRWFWLGLISLYIIWTNNYATYGISRQAGEDC